MPERNVTGILIFTAGREDAFEDYKRSVREGHSIDEIAGYLSAEERDRIASLYEGDVVHLWGTSAESRWNPVQRGDIALVYRDDGYIARADVVYTTENLELARALWDTGDNPWDDENPWKYLTFVADVEEVDVDAEEFNNLVGYETGYRPQGFTRVADRRIERLQSEWESVETAVAELTGTGEKIHIIENGDDTPVDDFVALLEAASQDGDRGEEFEQLVAKAFSRLGFDAQWIEGGGDTDVEITAPIHAIVEAKARSRNAGVVNMPATRVKNHREQRGADHGIVVARHFPPSSVKDATDNDLTTITAATLGDILGLRDRYGMPPEVIADRILMPGQVQDDRLDDLRAYGQDRVESMETVLHVIRALSKADEVLADANHIRMVAVGMMTMPADAPSEGEVEDAVALLSHPAVGLVTEDDAGYRLVTSYENALTQLRRLDTVIAEASDTVVNEPGQEG